MKDYDHVILWLDYFNKNLKRSQGRRIKRDKAVFDPTVAELEDAAKAAGYEFTKEEMSEAARFPRRPFVRSGYVMLAKTEGKTKGKVIDTVAEKMLQKRNSKKK